MQRWHAIQYDVLPELRAEVGVVTPKLARVVHVLEWARVEEFVAASWCGVGRPPHTRAWLANAFVAKAVLGIATTVGLIERLTMDKALRRICGFSPYARDCHRKRHSRERSQNSPRPGWASMCTRR
jgi:hypothetical protein